MKSIVLLQRQIGDAKDRTWEDYKIPEAPDHNKATIIERLTHAGAAGIYRLVYHDANHPNAAEVARFEIQPYQAYRVIDLPTDPEAVEPGKSGSEVLASRRRTQQHPSGSPPRR